jgi:hypothetical protein
MEQTRRSEPCSYFIVNDNKETITLEHILPEEPEGNWPQFTKEEVDAYSRRIGNLALLDKPNNSASRSAPFSAKKAIYGSVPYDFTSQLAVVTDWTKDSIVKRQAQMADVALKTWPMKTH